MGPKFRPPPIEMPIDPNKEKNQRDTSSSSGTGTGTGNNNNNNSEGSKVGRDDSNAPPRSTGVLEIKEDMTLVISEGQNKYVVKAGGIEDVAIKNNNQQQQQQQQMNSHSRNASSSSSASPGSCASTSSHHHHHHHNQDGDGHHHHHHHEKKHPSELTNVTPMEQAGDVTSASGNLHAPVETPFYGARGTRGANPEQLLGKVPFDLLEICEILGHGSQGRVRRVKHRQTGESLALKSIAFSSDIEPLRKALVHELERTTAIKHPNVVSSYEAYFRNGKMYILMEFMDCGTCSDVIKRHGKDGGITDDATSYIARHMLQGLAHLHHTGIAHRDIKPANCLVTSRGEVKISDFGVAGDVAQNQLLQTNIGSTPYMSPERIKSQPYSKACDIWSIGVSVAEIALGQFPFGKVKAKIFELCEIIAGGNAEPKWKELGPPGRVFSPDLIDFVRLCLLDQAKRPSAEELLKHPFMKLGLNIPPEQMGAFFKSKKSSSQGVTPASATSASPPCSPEKGGMGMIPADSLAGLEHVSAFSYASASPTPTVHKTKNNNNDSSVQQEGSSFENSSPNEDAAPKK